MSIEAKRRAVAVGLALFTLWPLVHRVLVMRFDISPWRFFGWAMYCQPKVPLDVEIYVRRGGIRLRFAEAAAETPETRRQRQSYAHRREMWGALLPPDELAPPVFEAVADAETVDIVVRRLTLQPSTALLQARERIYSYARQPPSSAKREEAADRDPHEEKRADGKDREADRHEVP